MKAIILNQPKDFSIKEIKTPSIKADEVLIRIKTSGICTNDVRDFKGECNYSYPRIGGHEYCGVIEEIGADVNTNRFHKGQKVVQYIIDDCKQCYYCKHGDENICEEHPKVKYFIMKVVYLAMVDLQNLLQQKQKIYLYILIQHHLKKWHLQNH